MQSETTTYLVMVLVAIKPNRVPPAFPSLVVLATYSFDMILTFGEVSVSPVTCVKYLGVLLVTEQSELNMKCHIKNSVSYRGAAASSSYNAGVSYATSCSPHSPAAWRISTKLVSGQDLTIATGYLPDIHVSTATARAVRRCKACSWLWTT